MILLILRQVLIGTDAVHRSPAHCIEYAHLIQWQQERSGDEFDTDNEEHMRWVYDKALQRSEHFGIQVCFSISFQHPSKFHWHVSQEHISLGLRGIANLLFYQVSLKQEQPLMTAEGPRSVAELLANYHLRSMLMCDWAGGDMAADRWRCQEHHPGHCVHQRHHRGRLRTGDAQAHHHV
jgi:hypothetical protein